MPSKFQIVEPWVKIKEGKDQEVRSAINILVHLVRDISILLSPAMPDTANKIQSFIGLKDLKWHQLGNFSSLAGHEVTKPSILFPKLDTSRVEKLRSKFSGESDAFEKLDLRVGKITSLEIHPEADHLYVLQVDLGEDKPRTICSGLAKQIEKDSLIDKHVVVVSNLAPAELRGVASEGMVLSVAKKKKLEETVTVGFEINFDGKVTGVEILKGRYDELNIEAMRVVWSLPIMTPAVKNGQDVKMSYQVPVQFSLK